MEIVNSFHIDILAMADSIKVTDPLKVMGIDQEEVMADTPQASWDLYEMIQAFLQVFLCFKFVYLLS